MKHIFSYIIIAFTLCSCSFLDPLPNGTYTDDNYSDYPDIIQGYVIKAYDLLPTSYYCEEYQGMDACTGDFLYTSTGSTLRQFSIGNAQPGDYPLDEVWERDYSAINYVNLFLKDDIGLKTRYLLDNEDNAKLQKYRQGDAYGLRAWYLFDLLKTFGGKSSDGTLLGVPVFTDPVRLETFDASSVERPSYDECVAQIISDCDNALKYLPEVNRDIDITPSTAMIDGAARYRALDGISILALKARVYLTWASPAFNPSSDKTRWEKAAKAAREVLDYKMTNEAAQKGGFDPLKAYWFTNHNDPEIIWTSNWESSPFETAFYPLGFGGSASMTPTQNIVDAFPMANGYPITDERSGYDSSRPYEGRDPRFYATIFYNGSQSLRAGEMTDVMYTFDSSEGGSDAPGLVGTSLTGYYTKKFIYNLWNPYDKTIQSVKSGIFFFRAGEMLLTFAEAANHVCGPDDVSKFGMSAKQALAYVRSRSTTDGTVGLGTVSDAYLDECALAGESAFDALVRNEWRVETCFEGRRFYDLRRWGTTVSDLNVAVKGVRINSGKYSYGNIETLSFPSPWLPLPYQEVRKCSSLVQNAGWESWK